MRSPGSFLMQRPALQQIAFAYHLQELNLRNFLLLKLRKPVLSYPGCDKKMPAGCRYSSMKQKGPSTLRPVFQARPGDPSNHTVRPGPRPVHLDVLSLCLEFSVCRSEQYPAKLCVKTGYSDKSVLDSPILPLPPMFPRW